MKTYLLQRTAQFVPVFFLGTVLIWALIYALPGNPAIALAGSNATPEQINAIQNRLGLNDPLWSQYLSWLGNAVQGDLGISWSSGYPVGQLILDRLPATVQLAMLAIVMVVLLAVPLGVASAVLPKSWVGRTANFIMAIGLAIPHFWVGILLILVFSISFQLLPGASVYVPVWEEPFNALRNTVLPALAIALHASTITARFIAASLSEVMGMDYIRSARAKGATESRVVLHHALRNSLLPTVTIVGIQLGQLLGGTVIVEVVFTYPGIGNLLYKAISARDYAVLQGVVLLIVIIFLLLNLLVDLLYARLDPRIRVG